jgi:hypothetical protein
MLQSCIGNTSKTSCCLKPPTKDPRCFYIIVCTSFHDRAANFSSATGLRIICYLAELQWATTPAVQPIQLHYLKEHKWFLAGVVSYFVQILSKRSHWYIIHRWRVKRNPTAEKARISIMIQSCTCASPERLKTPPGAMGTTSIFWNGARHGSPNRTSARCNAHRTGSLND